MGAEKIAVEFLEFGGDSEATGSLGCFVQVDSGRASSHTELVTAPSG
jgi:hypothetical protein